MDRWLSARSLREEVRERFRPGRVLALWRSATEATASERFVDRVAGRWERAAESFLEVLESVARESAAGERSPKSLSAPSRGRGRARSITAGFDDRARESGPDGLEGAYAPLKPAQSGPGSHPSSPSSGDDAARFPPGSRSTPGRSGERRTLPSRSGGAAGSPDGDVGSDPPPWVDPTPPGGRPGLRPAVPSDSEGVPAAGRIGGLGELGSPPAARGEEIRDLQPSARRRAPASGSVFSPLGFGSEEPHDQKIDERRRPGARDRSDALPDLDREGETVRDAFRAPGSAAGIVSEPGSVDWEAFEVWLRDRRRRDESIREWETTQF